MKTTGAGWKLALGITVVAADLIVVLAPRSRSGDGTAKRDATPDRRAGPETARETGAMASQTNAGQKPDAARPARPGIEMADLPVAAAWLAQWEDGIVRDIAVKTLGAYLADTDEERAREWIAALPESALKTELLEGACAQGGGRAFEAILAWAQSLPDGPQKERSLIHLSYQWERRDFQAALTYAQSQREGNDALAVLLANQWVEQESKAASQWAATLPAGERRQKVLASLTAKWAQRDPGAAAEFVYHHLSPGPEQQQATISVVSTWAASIDDDTLRRQKAERAARAWLAADPTAARTWIATSNLPDSVKQNLLKTFSL